MAGEGSLGTCYYARHHHHHHHHPGPEIESDPQTGNFIGTALARMERGKAFSIILGRPQEEVCAPTGPS
jgi:hypothetical protein